MGNGTTKQKQNIKSSSVVPLTPNNVKSHHIDNNNRLDVDATDDTSLQPLSPSDSRFKQDLTSSRLKQMAIGTNINYENKREEKVEDKHEYDIKAARNIGNKVLNNNEKTPKKLLSDEIINSSEIIKTSDYGSVNPNLTSYPNYDVTRTIPTAHKHPKAPPITPLKSNATKQVVNEKHLLPQFSVSIAPSTLPVMQDAISYEPDLTDNYMNTLNSTQNYQINTNHSNEISYYNNFSPEKSISPSRVIQSPVQSKSANSNSYITDLIADPVVQSNIKNLASKDIDLDSIPDVKDNDDSDDDDEQVYDWINDNTNSGDNKSSQSNDSSLYATFGTPDQRKHNEPVPAIPIIPNKSQSKSPSSTDHNSIQNLLNISPLVIKTAENNYNIPSVYSPSIGSKSSRSPVNRSPVNVLGPGPGPLPDNTFNSLTGNATMNTMSSVAVLYPMKQTRQVIPNSNIIRKPATFNNNSNITNTNVHAVIETKDVKRNIIDLPTQFVHAKPTNGDWISKRYFINNYILLTTLGKGSYGEVKMCKNCQTEQLYAMKIVSKDLMKKRKNGNSAETYFEDIKREIAIMKKLLHPNVLRLFEVLDDPKVNKLYLILEYMSKGDLINYLKEKEELYNNSNTNNKPNKNSKALKVTLNDMELWNIFRQVVSGLRYLHYQNIVHGDIKPQNLLVGNDGIVKIADFGISKMLHTPNDKLNDAAGTPAFMSPELCSGEIFSGQLADVWALGATMYMLKFGHPPFVAKTIINLYHKIQNDELVFPFTINNNLQDLFVKMLTKDPSKRITLEGVTLHIWLQSPPITKSNSNTDNLSNDNTSNNTQFNPPNSYYNEEQSVMQHPKKLSIGNNDLFNSITVGNSLNPSNDLIEQNDNANDNEDILHTNWGDDVFNIVQNDSIDSSEDSNDYDINEYEDVKEATNNKQRIENYNINTNTKPSSEIPTKDHINNVNDNSKNSKNIMEHDEEERRMKRFQSQLNNKPTNKFTNHTNNTNNNIIKSANSSCTNSPTNNQVTVNSNASTRVGHNLDSPMKTPFTNRGDSIFSRNDDIEDTNELSMEAFEHLMDTLARQPKKTKTTDENIIDDRLVIDSTIVTSNNSNSYNGVTIDYHTEQGLRDTQEDRCVVMLDLNSKNNDNKNNDIDLLQKFSLVCIFDGHNGSKCSHYLSKEIPKLIVQNIKSLHRNSIDTFKEISKTIDEQICSVLRKDDDPSGSTGVILLYDGKKRLLTVANVGDSMCVLSRAGRAVMTHTMHRLDSIAERTRVEKSGGLIINNRVNGILAITRAYGDVPFKDSTDSITNGPIISVPEIYTEIITPGTEFGILACDGLWDVITPQNAVNFVRKKLNMKCNLKEITRLLTLEALREGSIDNVTIAIITFNLPTTP